MVLALQSDHLSSLLTNIEIIALKMVQDGTLPMFLLLKLPPHAHGTFPCVEFDLRAVCCQTLLTTECIIGCSVARTLHWPLAVNI